MCGGHGFVLPYRTLTLSSISIDSCGPLLRHNGISSLLVTWTKVLEQRFVLECYDYFDCLQSLREPSIHCSDFYTSHSLLYTTASSDRGIPNRTVVGNTHQVEERVNQAMSEPIAHSAMLDSGALGGDFDLSDDLFDFNAAYEDIDFTSDLNIDFFSEPFLDALKDQSSTLASDIPASPADVVPEGEPTNADLLNTPLQVAENDKAESPLGGAQADAPEQVLLSQAPQSRLPSRNNLILVPGNLDLKPCSPPPTASGDLKLRPCSPPPGTAGRFNPGTPQPSVRGSIPSSPQQRAPSTSTPGLTRNSMGPPPPGPLNLRRKAPLVPEVHTSSLSLAPSPSRKRKHDEEEEQFANLFGSIDGPESPTAFDPAGQKPSKNTRLEHGEWKLEQLVVKNLQKVKDGEERDEVRMDWLRRKENEARRQAVRFREKEKEARRQAVKFSEKETIALQRCSYYAQRIRDSGE